MSSAFAKIFTKDQERRRSRAGSDKNGMRRLTNEELNELPDDKLVLLPGDLLVKLTPERLNELPPGFLSTLAPHILIQILPHLHSTRLAALNPAVFDSFANLGPEMLATLPVEVLKRLSVDRLALLPPEALSRLPPEVISRLPVSILRQLPPETLARLPLYTLAKHPHDVLSSLPSPGSQWVQADSHLREHLPSEPDPAVAPPSEQTKTTYQGRSRSPQLHSQAPAQGLPETTGRLERSGSGRQRPSSWQYWHSREPEPQAAKETDRDNSTLPQETVEKTPESLAAQRRASRRQLRRDAKSRLDLRPASPISEATVPGPSVTTDNPPAEIRLTSPLGAVISDAKDLKRLSDSQPRRSSSRRRRKPCPEPSAGAAADPTEHSKVIKEIPQQSAQAPSADAVNSRVPSSGSPKTVTSDPKRSWFDSRPERPSARDIDPQDPKHRDQSPDGRPIPPQRSRPRDRDRVNEPSQEPRSQHGRRVNSDTQLQESLRERERVILDLRRRLDQQEATASSLQRAFQEQRAHTRATENELRAQKDDYEDQLAKLRDTFTKEQAKQEQNALVMSKTHQDELSSRTSDLQKRIKELKLDLLAQKSRYDEMVHEQRQSFDSESKRHQEQIHQLNERLEHQKLVFERESDAREKAVREKQADYQSRQLALQEELQVQKVRFAAEIQKIRTYYEERSKKLESTLEKQNAYHSTQESQLMAHHRHEMESLKAQLQAEIEQIKDSSSSYTKSLHHQFEEEIGAHREHFTQEMQRMADSHQDELRRLKLEHERTIESLRSDSGDQIRQATDSDLMGLFRRLKLAIEVVTYNLGTVTISEASQLDPTNFLKRERGRQQVLLRSILWSKILEGYFSSPFGFGVFGAGSGKKMLVELFLYWRKLFAIHHAGDANTETPVPDANFDIHDLWRDKEANRWRSATFQSVMAIMAGKGGKNGSADTADEGGQTVGNLYVMNRVKLKKDILAVLEEATSDQLAGEIEEKLDEITCLAGELALQIGVHRACLGLEMPATGESVIIGPEFVDCEDGAAARGETEEVDLVVCPHFFKVGDGRSDLKTRKSIFPGEIYPVRP